MSGPARSELLPETIRKTSRATPVPLNDCGTSKRRADVSATRLLATVPQSATDCTNCEQGGRRQPPLPVHRRSQNRHPIMPRRPWMRKPPARAQSRQTACSWLSPLAAFARLTAAAAPGCVLPELILKIGSTAPNYRQIQLRVDRWNLLKCLPSGSCAALAVPCSRAPVSRFRHGSTRTYS